MANTLDTVRPEFWATEAERSLFVENRAMVIAKTTLRNLVAGEGDTVNRQIIDYPARETYTPGSDLTNRNVVSSQEQLQIATWSASKVTIDDTEKRQSLIDIASNIAKKMMENHNNAIDQAVFAEVTNSLWSLDDGNLAGGTAGNNMRLTTSNIPEVFTAADNKLDATDAPKGGRVAVIGSHFLNTLKLQQANRATAFGDGVNTRGVIVNLFGWDLLYSNNLRWTATLGMATQVTEGDTVTIAGVVFTFNATPSGAGSVDIGSTAAVSVDNLVAAINDAGTVGTTYIQLSAENRWLLRDKRGIVATDATTSITFVGYGDIVVSETLTAAADVWSAELQGSLFCIKGCVDIIVQIPPKIETVRDPDQFSDIVKSLLGYGKKTYADGAREMVYVKIDASKTNGNGWV